MPGMLLEMLWPAAISVPLVPRRKIAKRAQICLHSKPRHKTQELCTVQCHNQAFCLHTCTHKMSWLASCGQSVSSVGLMAHSLLCGDAEGTLRHSHRRWEGEASAKPTHHRQLQWL